MSSEKYISLYKTNEIIRLTVITNICRMLVSRGYMDIEKYKSDGKLKRKNPADSPSVSDRIDNDKFLHFINEKTETNVYTIPLDVHYKDDRLHHNNDILDFDGSKIIVKLIPQKVKDITNSPVVDEFLKNYDRFHKIIVFDEMSDKVYNTLNKKYNVESFDRDYFMIDMMSHECAPIECTILADTDISHILKPNISKISSNDPLVRYYDAKKGNILRVVRPSLNNSREIALLRVGEQKKLK